MVKKSFLRVTAMTVAAATALLVYPFFMDTPAVAEQDHSERGDRFRTCSETVREVFAANELQLVALEINLQNKITSAENVSKSASQYIETGELDEAISVARNAVTLVNAEIEKFETSDRGRVVEDRLKDPLAQEVTKRCAIFLQTDELESPRDVIDGMRANFFQVPLGVSQAIDSLEETSNATKGAALAEKERLAEIARAASRGVNRVREPDAPKTPSTWNVHLTASSHWENCQATIDRGHWAYCDYDMGIPWFGVHTSVNSTVLRMKIGDIVKITGQGFDGTYKVVSSLNARFPVAASILYKLGSGYALQTCYPGAMNMRLVGIDKIG